MKKNKSPKSKTECIQTIRELWLPILLAGIYGFYLMCTKEGFSQGFGGLMSAGAFILFLVAYSDEELNDIRAAEEKKRETGESSVILSIIGNVRANPQMLRKSDPFSAASCISPDPIPKKHR